MKNLSSFLKVILAISCCIVAIVVVTGEVKGNASPSYDAPSYQILTVNTIDGVKVEVEYSTPELLPEEKCKIYEHFSKYFKDIDWTEELLPGVVVGYHIK